MAGFLVSEYINCTPEEIFKFICDFGEASKWIAGVVKVEKVTQEPISVGMRYREIRVAGGREGGAEMEIIEYDPPRCLAARFAEGGYVIEYNYEIKEVETGSRVEMKYSVNGGGLKWLFVPIVAWVTGRQDKSRLKSLKRAIEGEESSHGSRD